MTYSGLGNQPQRPSDSPWSHSQSQSYSPPLSPEPQGYSGAGGPPYAPPPQSPPPPGHAPEPAAPKKRTGLIIGVILGIVVLIGLGIGGVLLFGGESSKNAGGAVESTAIDPAGLTSVCQLLDVKMLAQKAGVQGLQAVEVPRVDTGITDFQLGCVYTLPDGKPFEALEVKVYQEGTCEPARCIALLDLPGKQPLTEVGEAALFFNDGYGSVIAMATMGKSPVQVKIIGSSPTATAEELKPLVNQVFDKIKKG